MPRAWVAERRTKMRFNIKNIYDLLSECRMNDPESTVLTVMLTHQQQSTYDFSVIIFILDLGFYGSTIKLTR